MEYNVKPLNLSASYAWTGAHTFTNAAGIVTRQAATQDGMALVGRAGGTSSYQMSLMPLTQTGNHNWSFPDSSDTVAGLLAQTFTGTQTFSTGITISGSNLTLNSGSTIVVDDTTDSTSGTTGSIQTDGGLGVAKSIYTTAVQTIDLGTGATGTTVGTALRAFGADAGNVQFAAATFGSANGGTFYSYNIGGTRASQTATLNASAFWTFIARGHDGTAQTGSKASFGCSANGLWSGANTGTIWTWAGTLNGATSIVTWLWLQGTTATDPFGTLGIGATPTAGNGLLQLASGTTKAYGVAWGTDVFLFRSAATTLTLDSASILAVASTTTSTSTTTGALTVAGGIGVAGQITFDGATTKSLRVTNGVANAAVAVTFGSVGPTGSTAGNAQGWLRISVAGTDRYIPYW